MLLPITVLALLAGAMKILLTLACPWLAGTWAIGAAAPAAMLRHAVDALAHLPGAGVPMAAPPIWLIVGYYALLLIPLIPWQRTVTRWAARCMPVTACIAVLMLLLATCCSWQISSRCARAIRTPGLRLTLPPPSRASKPGLVRVPGGESFFVDCGSTTVPDVYRRIIEPYLRHEGIRRIDEIYLSHGDYDHICVATEIVEGFGMPTVLMTPHFRRHAQGNIPAEALLTTSTNCTIRRNWCKAGDTFDVGGGESCKSNWVA